ncbi:hypothetical protein FRB90_012503 [Tulasnella sp. 427]|nr:hypothetical protein FRB90_012503 [Tulasnella sp. 427]
MVQIECLEAWAESWRQICQESLIGVDALASNTPYRPAQLQNTFYTLKSLPSLDHLPIFADSLTDDESSRCKPRGHSPSTRKHKPSPIQINSAAVDALLEKLKASIVHLEAARAQLEADSDPEDPANPASEDSSENSALHLRRLVARHQLWEAWVAAGHAIQPKSLSTVNWYDLRKLSIYKDRVIRLSIDDLQEAFRRELKKAKQQESAKYNNAADAAADGLFPKYELWLDAVNKTNEAASRIWVNSVIECIMLLVQDVNFDEEPGKMFRCSELSTPRETETVESLTDHPSTVVLDALGGKSDYVTIYIPNWLAIAERVQTQLSRYITKIKSIGGEGFDKNWSHLLQTACVTMYEAKRLGARRGILENAVPKTIAEALVLGQRLKHEDDERHRTVPAILTDGCRWIFILLKPELQAGNLERWQYFQSDVYTLQPDQTKLSRENFVAS